MIRTFATSVTLAGLMLAFGCAQPRRPAAAPADDFALPESKAAQQEEVRRLIDLATTGINDDSRALAALATADRAIADIANTIKAVDTARLSVVTNLRNIDTTAFKATSVRVDDGEKVSSTLNMEQGSLENTGRPLDIAIQGEGFFKVKTADSVGAGIGYTRNGNLFINPSGELVVGTGDGLKLIPPLTVPAGATEITITQDGTLEVTTPGASAKTRVGQIQLSLFTNPSRLQLHASAVYIESQTSGAAKAVSPGDAGAGQILQGFLETSNVDLVRERLRLAFLNAWRATLMESAGLPSREK